jgi:hypothetical protein
VTEGGLTSHSKARMMQESGIDAPGVDLDVPARQTTIRRSNCRPYRFIFFFLCSLSFRIEAQQFRMCRESDAPWPCQETAWMVGRGVVRSSVHWQKFLEIQGRCDLTQKPSIAFSSKWKAALLTPRLQPRESLVSSLAGIRSALLLSARASFLNHGPPIAGGVIGFDSGVVYRLVRRHQANGETE